MTDAAPVRETWMCQYTGKLCVNERASGPNGLLRLCAFHSALANRNQQRYQARQRMLKKRARQDTFEAATRDATATRSDLLPSEPLELAMLPSMPSDPDTGPPFDLPCEADDWLLSWVSETLEEITSDAKNGEIEATGIEVDASNRDAS